MSKLDKIGSDADDPVIRKLRQRIRDAKPYEPKPGDADYIAPERRQQILKERRKDGMR